MLVNTSYNDKKVNQEIDTLVGAPFGFFERIKMSGVGSPQMRIRTASKEILSLLNKNTNRNVANIELRPKGILIYFSNRLDRYSWIVPYYRLVIFNTETFSIHSNGKFIRFMKNKNYKSNRSFMNKMMKLKNQFLDLKKL